MIKADDLTRECPQARIDGMWVLARPINYQCRTLWERLTEAWAVFWGRAEAVKFYKQ